CMTNGAKEGCNRESVRCRGAAGRLLAVSAGMLVMPLPRRCDDRHDVVVARCPFELALGERAVGYEFGWVARPARSDCCWNLVAGHLPAGLDDLLDAETVAGAEIQFEGLAGREPLERFDVGVAQVFDVDVIANAGAIGGGIVVAVDGDVLALA